MNRSHPLRRPSTGSLSSLARSTDRNASSPSGLDFLQPALAELNDEASTLATNVSHLTELHDALGTFNESFAGYLYALRMNAFCVEWLQAPDENSFARLANLEKQLQDAQKAIQLAEQQQLQQQQQAAQQAALAAAPAAVAQPSAADMTYATAYSSEDAHPPSAAARSKASLGGAKKAAAPNNTLAAKKQALANKKKRELEISQIVDTLPLEYRGNQPDLHKAMEKVISTLMDAPDGLPLKALVTPPLIPQARANKCLIALVTKKLVVKNNVGGTAFYMWAGP